MSLHFPETDAEAALLPSPLRQEVPKEDPRVTISEADPAARGGGRRRASGIGGECRMRVAGLGWMRVEDSSARIYWPRDQAESLCKVSH